MERRLVNPDAGNQMAQDVQMQSFFWAVRQRKEKGASPAGMGGKEPRKPQLCRMAEGNFSELFGRTQAKKGNLGFLASERQREKFQSYFPW